MSYLATLAEWTHDNNWVIRKKPPQLQMYMHMFNCRPNHVFVNNFSQDQRIYVLSVGRGHYVWGHHVLNYCTSAPVYRPFPVITARSPQFPSHATLITSVRPVVIDKKNSNFTVCTKTIPLPPIPLPSLFPTLTFNSI